jgi:hypothetical protein
MGFKVSTSAGQSRAKHTTTSAPAPFVILPNIVNSISRLLRNGVKAFHDPLVSRGKTLQGWDSPAFGHLA